MNQPRPGKLHQLSAPILLFIHGLPRWVFPIFTAAILLAGLFISDGTIGAVFLVILGFILWWLVALSWRLLSGTARAMRTIVILVVFAYAYGRFTGRY